MIWCGMCIFWISTVSLLKESQKVIVYACVCFMWWSWIWDGLLLISEYISLDMLHFNLWIIAWQAFFVCVCVVESRWRVYVLAGSTTIFSVIMCARKWSKTLVSLHSPSVNRCIACLAIRWCALEYELYHSLFTGTFSGFICTGITGVCRAWTPLWGIFKNSESEGRLKFSYVSEEHVCEVY
jgi:hypothetical protein